MIVWLRKGTSCDGDPMTEIHADKECLDFIGAYDNGVAKRLGLPLASRKRGKLRASLSLCLTPPQEPHE